MKITLFILTVKSKSVQSTNNNQIPDMSNDPSKVMTFEAVVNIEAPEGVLGSRENGVQRFQREPGAGDPPLRGLNIAGNAS